MKKLCTIMIIAAGIMWGCSGVFVKALTPYGFSSAQIAAARLTVAALIFILMNLKSPQLLKIKAKDIWMFALLGICSILGMAFVYFETIKRTSLSIAAILLYTAPIMVTVMSAVFYREKITRVKLLALIGSFAGIVLISKPDSSNNITAFGITLGLISAFTYALYSIIGKFVLIKYQPATVTTYAFVFAAAGALILCNLPDMAAKFAATDNSITVALIAVATGIVTAAVPYALYTAALKKTDAGKASVLASVEPMSATLIGIVFFNERLGPAAAAGIILILVSVTFLSSSKA